MRKIVNYNQCYNQSIVKEWKRTGPANICSITWICCKQKRPLEIHNGNESGKQVLAAYTRLGTHHNTGPNHKPSWSSRPLPVLSSMATGEHSLQTKAGPKVVHTVCSLQLTWTILYWGLIHTLKLAASAAHRLYLRNYGVEAYFMLMLPVVGLTSKQTH